MTQEPTRTVFTALDPLEASAVSALLEGSGIACSVRDMRITPYPVSVGPLSEQHVVVADQQYEEARTALLEAASDGVVRRDGIHSADAPDDR